MINKKNLWFLTLFSLVLVLSIYYVTMPEDLLQATTGNLSDLTNDNINVNIEESNTIAALKVEDDSRTTDTINELQEELSKTGATLEQKNTIYEQIKTINTNNGLEEQLEKKINESYNCETFTKIEKNTVKVVVDKCENSKSLANNIMRSIQEEYDSQKYITVKFTT